jgi:carbon-monoxide dehydrogenase iron sulfur subunit
MKRVYVNEKVCIGCHLCEVYCQLHHAGTKDLVKAFRQGERPLPRLRLDEKGIVALSVRCQHCDDAPCVQACLTGALSRDPLTGITTVNEAKCIGCGTCMLVCPLGALRLDKGHKKALKCDLCQDEEIPACVANCPNEALVFVEEDGEASHVAGQSAAPVK